MFRSKHIFKDLHEYVNELESRTTCPAEPIIPASQIGGRTNVNVHNKRKNVNNTTNKYAKYKDKFDLNQTGVFTDVDRIVAIGDIHGDIKALFKALYKANIIKTNGEWDKKNKRTIVIQLGDLLDRGGRGQADTDNYKEEIEILQYIEYLNKKAQEVDSAFITLIGNHELMNILGDFRYVSANAMKGMGGEEGRRKLFAAGGPIAKHLGCCSYGICKIGDWTFVHAGVLPQHLKDDNFSFSSVNQLVRGIMRGTVKKHNLNPSQREFIFGNNGLFWTRELAKDNPNCSLANESVSILNNEKGNGGIIVGHTIQKNGINSKCGGKVWAIDTGMSDAFGKSGDSNIQVLEILNNKKVNIL